MFTYKKYSKYLEKAIEVAHEKIHELYDEEIDRLHREQEGRMKLAMLSNRADVATASEIRETIREYLLGK